jgi:Na+/H+ antiporter NhaC
VDTFILFIVTVVAWFGLEFWRVFRGDITISEQIRNLHKLWPAIGFLAALVVGLLIGHFFFNPDVPLFQLGGIVAGLGFGILAGALWFR